jgi:dephospho-CoA kinase
VLSVALTGNVASGKSAVAAFWADAGVPVISADELSRRAVMPGTRGLKAVTEAFGVGLLAPDGTLDRARLRALVFADPAARERLERILHPLIRELRTEWMEERRREGDALVVSEIPLLFETEGEAAFDVVVLVDAPAEVRLERLVGPRGLSEAEARSIIAAQMDPARKRGAAHIVIDNVGSMDDLGAEAALVLADLRARAGGVVRLDLHMHTRGSRDCLTDPAQMLRRALAIGYERIAITDHDRLGVALRMSERHPDRVIAGEEVKTAEGVDVIGLYLREEIPKGTPARETILRIHSLGGIAYHPPPFAPGKGGGGRLADELAPSCDVIEAFNARLHDPALNRRADELAARLGKPRGAGSDAHTVREVGNAFVVVAAHANRPDALLRALAGPARVGGTAASRLVHLASTWAKARKKLPGARRD